MTEKQVREKKIVAATSVGAAVFLTGTKLAIGLLTGSLGILAEAAHSALDWQLPWLPFLRYESVIVLPTRPISTDTRKSKI